MRILAVILTCLLWITTAAAQINGPGIGITGSLGTLTKWSTATRPAHPVVGLFGYNTTLNTLEVFNGTTWVATGSNGVVDITAFGAKCDGITDDSTAINLAINTIRALVGFDNQVTAKLTGPLSNTCLIQNTVDLTVINKLNVTIELPQLTCSNPNGICVDALGSANFNWVRFNLFGSCAQPGGFGDTSQFALVGVQLGRTAPTQQATEHYFDRPVIKGCFLRGNLYKFGTEITTIYQPNIINFNGQPGLIDDGLNHFNVQSPLAAARGSPETAPTDTCVSFNENLVIGGWIGSEEFKANGPDIPVWLSCYGHREYRNLYVCSGCGVGTSTYGFMLFAPTTNTNNDGLIIDVHTEVPVAGLIVAGLVSNPVISGLKYSENFMFNSESSLFALDSTGAVGAQFDQPGCTNAPSPQTCAVAVTSATVTGLDVRVAEVQSTAIPILDNPSAWTLSGSIYVPLQNMYTEPASFSGTVCLSDATPNCTTYTPTEAVNRNPDFILDQPLEGTTATAAFPDGWRLNANTGGWVQFQRLSSGSPTGYVYNLATSVISVNTPSSGQFTTMKSIVEGPTAARLGFLSTGAPSGLKFSFDFCAEANNPGTYAAWVQNGIPNRSYVFTYSATNTWTCFHNVIPVDTNSAYLTGLNQIGLRFGFTFGAGSTYQTTANTWTTGEFYAPSTAFFNYTGTSGATLNIAAVHIYPGKFKMPYLFRPMVDEYLLADRWYLKSFLAGVKPAQNSGSEVGAATIVASITSASIALSTKVTFPHRMFVNNSVAGNVPAITFFSPGAATANCFDVTTAGDIGAATALNVGDDGFTVSCAAGSGYTAGDVITVHWRADTGM